MTALHLRPDLEARIEARKATEIRSAEQAAWSVVLDALHYHQDTGHELEPESMYGTCDIICNDLAVLDRILK